MHDALRPPVLIAVAGLAVLIALTLLLRHSGAAGPSAAERQAALRAGCRQSDAAFSRHESNIWLSLSGTVSRLLPDEHGRFVHQRFVLRCADGHTVLIVNDVDIGRRVPAAMDDTVAVRGEYVWNPQGGLVHFTHHDPQGGQGGWIQDHGAVYALARFGLMTQTVPTTQKTPGEDRGPSNMPVAGGTRLAPHPRIRALHPNWAGTGIAPDQLVLLGQGSTYHRSLTRSIFTLPGCKTPVNGVCQYIHKIRA